MNRQIATVAIAIFSAVTHAQSLNIDISVEGNPAVGGGVPSDSFGAAANQPGRWNYLDVVGIRESLFDLQGNVVPVSIDTATSGGPLMGGGFANQSNTGDYAKLLNDAAHVAGVWRSWTFGGLTNGTYRVVTFAVQYSSDLSRAEVHVSNSLVTNPQIVQGVMPGNQLIPGVTHSTHLAQVTNGSLEVRVFKGIAPNYPMVNGFQLTAVPEPNSLCFAVLAFVGLARRKRTTR